MWQYQSSQIIAWNTWVTIRNIWTDRNAMTSAHVEQWLEDQMKFEHPVQAHPYDSLCEPETNNSKMKLAQEQTELDKSSKIHTTNKNFKNVSKAKPIVKRKSKAVPKTGAKFANRLSLKTFLTGQHVGLFNKGKSSSKIGNL